MADKTRAERIEEAARTLCEHYKTNRHYGPTWCVRDLREALALPPDPPRGDGWGALRWLRSNLTKMRQKSAEEYGDDDGSGYQLDCIDVMLRRLLAASKETP